MYTCSPLLVVGPYLGSAFGSEWFDTMGLLPFILAAVAHSSALWLPLKEFSTPVDPVTVSTSTSGVTRALSALNSTGELHFHGSSSLALSASFLPPRVATPFAPEAYFDPYGTHGHHHHHHAAQHLQHQPTHGELSGSVHQRPACCTLGSCHSLQLLQFGTSGDPMVLTYRPTTTVAVSSCHCGIVAPPQHQSPPATLPHGSGRPVPPWRLIQMVERVISLMERLIYELHIGVAISGQDFNIGFGIAASLWLIITNPTAMLHVPRFTISALAYFFPTALTLWIGAFNAVLKASTIITITTIACGFYAALGVYHIIFSGVIACTIAAAAALVGDSLTLQLARLALHLLTVLNRACNASAAAFGLLWHTLRVATSELSEFALAARNSTCSDELSVIRRALRGKKRREHYCNWDFCTIASRDHLSSAHQLIIALLSADATIERLRPFTSGRILRLLTVTTAYVRVLKLIPFAATVAGCDATVGLSYRLGLAAFAWAESAATPSPPQGDPSL